MVHKSSFDIKTVQDFLYKMIIPQYEEFKENNSSSRHALLTIILVYHMREWANKSVKDKQLAYSDDIAEMHKLVGDIANGTKHFVHERAATRVGPGFSSGFSDGFARPLNVKSCSDREVSVDELLDKLVEFWKEQDQLGNLK